MSHVIICGILMGSWIGILCGFTFARIFDCKLFGIITWVVVLSIICSGLSTFVMMQDKKTAESNTTCQCECCLKTR